MNVSWLDWAGGYTIYLQPPTVVQDSQDFCLDIFSGQFLSIDRVYGSILLKLFVLFFTQKGVIIFKYNIIST